MAHACHAHECKENVPPRMFMCRVHWFRLRRQVQRVIWREYRPGQEQDKKPSLRYMAVQQYAIGILAFKPFDEEAARIAAPYLLKSEVFRKLAIESGNWDPLDGIAGPSKR